MIIAIDGYSCTGKSTMANLLAQELKFKQINTGLIYRYFGFKLLQNSITSKNFTSKERDIKRVISDAKINLAELEKNILILKEKNVSEIGKLIAKDPYVRDKIGSYIIAISLNTNIIVEGRDIGTTVFPNADYKFFFFANDEIRAKRLCEERGNTDFEETLKEIRERDNDDITRENSPLKKSKNAIEIDTSIKNKMEILKQILNVIKR